ncbi:WD40-repeat-containing domain protein [Gongronella butleri]|nr:WD40-repeat-containing domain protein [Gongronella butleri]
MLSSVSDDRTIHVWDLVDTQRKPQVIYGHESRVWDCQFVDNLLVSISEDATCRVWKNNLLSTAENDQSTENEDILDETRNCLACWEGHGGKNVWSCAVSPDHRVVATGGQDSAVRLWSLEAIHCNKIDDDKDLTILNLPDDTHDDTARSFAFVRNEKVLSCTHHGQFVRYDVDAANKAQSASPHLLFQDQDFFSYSSMHHSECGELIVCCTVRGALMFYSPSNQFASLKVSVQAQKIDSVDIHKSELHDGIFYVISFAQNEVYLHELDVSVPEKPEHRTLYTLMGPGERTTITCTELLEERGLLICGSRESAMLVYRLPELGGASNVTKHRLFPSIQVRRMHGKQNISSVKCKPVAEGDDDADGITFWTTGRDGCYAEHRLSMLDGAPHFYPESLADMVTGVASRSESATRCNDLLLETVYRNKVTKGWLEGLVYVDNELLLLGFYRKNFFVYNETKRFEVISIACGGAHRRWHFHTKDARLDHSIFGFIRNKVLCTYIRDGNTSQGPFQESMLQQDYHGREVRAIQFHETKDPEGSPLFLFATAGEDTMVRVHQYIPGQSRFTTHSVLRKHASVVKCVQWSDGIDTLLFTAGGKEQLRCWKLDLRKQAGTASLALNCLEWATCPMVGDKSTETRIMDLTSFVYNKIKGIHLIGAVYSDSMIRIFVFDELTRKFALVVDGTWHAKCILQMDHCLVQQDQGRDRLLFFTAATDGRVAVWDISSALFATLETMDVLVDPTHPSTKFTEPISHFSVHLSGVNALQVVHWDAQTLLVMTGGEDNAMAATLIDKTTCAVVSGPAHVPDAHASSLTGLHVLHAPTSTDHSVLVATTSIDQRLNLWKVAQCGSDLQITLINAAFVDVPDPSALHGLQHGDETYLAATGIGLQAFKYHPPSSST